MNQDERRAWDAVERGEVRQVLERAYGGAIAHVLVEWIHAGKEARR